MIIYLVIATIIFWGAYTKNPRFFYVLGFFCIFIISAFRDVTLGGTDALNYDRIYQQTPGLFNLTKEDLLSDYSVGYILLNSAIRTFSTDFRVFQFLYVAITLFLLYKIIGKLRLSNKEKCILLFSYFCFRLLWYEWVLLRQNFADLIFWYCIVSCYYSLSYKRKTFYIICSLLLPPLFHTSAFLNLLLLPMMYLLDRWSFSKKKYYVPIFSVLIYVLSSIVVNYFFPYMVFLGGDRYENYSEAISTEMGNGNIVNYILRFFFYFAFILNYHRDKSTNKDLVMKTIIMVIIIGSVNFSSVNRMYEYYAIGLYLAQTKLLSYYKQPMIRFAYWLGMLLIFGRFLTISAEGTFLNYSMWLFQ